MLKKILAGFLFLCLFAVIVCTLEFSDRAYAALTFSNQEQIPQRLTGVYKMGYVDITFDSSGPEWAIDAADLHLNGILFLLPQSLIGGYPLIWDIENEAVRVYQIDNNNETDGPAIDADAADVNGRTGRVFYMGY